MHFLEQAFLISVERSLFLLVFLKKKKIILCDLLLIFSFFSFYSFASFKHLLNMLDVNDMIHVILDG